MTKRTTGLPPIGNRLEKRIKDIEERNRHHRSDAEVRLEQDGQADMFSDVERIDESSNDWIIESKRKWHRDLSKQIVEYSRELEHFNEVGNISDAEMVHFLREGLITTCANIDVAIEELLNSGKMPATAEGKGLLRQRHPNRDFFLADMFDYALKDDGASMEAPIFTLATRPDISVWQWKSKDGKKSIKVTPSVLGRATQHDKDVLIYVVSQLTAALNQDREDAKHRVVRFTVYDFLVATNRGVGGDDYRRLQEAFERLAGTRVTTDIKTGGLRVKEGFGIIDRWKIIDRSANDNRMIAVEVTLSEWLYNAVQAHDVLTIHRDYFRLRKPLERRLYELGRKHCGRQAKWTIGLSLLHEKSGSRGSIYEFHEAVKRMVEENNLPEYRISLTKGERVAENKVTFFTRDAFRLVQQIGRK